jgi:SAM-dependent methyltransferase
VRTNRAGTVVPVRGDVQAFPFASGSFDAVVAITVLYTVADDERALAEVARVLAPGGAVVVVEPAFESLRRAHDVTVHGRRRYRTDDLTRLARGAGLTPWRTTYAYSFLAPPAYALARIGRAAEPAEETGSDVERRSLDRVFAPLAAAERRALTRRDVPFGTSALLLALKE